MANIQLLKARMAEAGAEHFVKELSEVLHITMTTASKKMTNKRPFKIQEVKVLAEKYNLKNQDIKKIFFD